MNVQEKAITTCLILAAGLLFVAQPVFSGVITKEHATPIAATVFDPCDGENVAFNGTINTIATLTTTPGGLIATFHSNFRQISAIGETTGIVYQLHCTENMTRLEAPSPTTTPSIQTTVRLCILSGNNALFNALAHYSITPDGDVAVSFDNFEVQCTGREGTTPEP